MQKTNHRDNDLPFLQALLTHPSALILPSLPFSNDSDPSTWHPFDCPVYQTMKYVSIPHKLLWIIIYKVPSAPESDLSCFSNSEKGFPHIDRSIYKHWTFRKSLWGFEGLKDSVSENDRSRGIWMLTDHFFVGNCLIFQGIHFYHQSTQSIV